MTRLKQELNKKLKKPRELIAYGLDFLSLLGTQGEVIGEQLVLDEQRHAAFLRYVRDKKRFLQGMQAVGLEARTSDGTVVFHSEHFPAMMPALKALATACSQRATSPVMPVCTTSLPCKSSGSIRSRYVP